MALVAGKKIYNKKKIVRKKLNKSETNAYLENQNLICLTNSMK